MEPDRLNSPTTFEMPLEILGHELQFSQEKNCRKGKFSPAKLKGKRVIELGAGCGVSGFGMALLGCDVIVTDQKEILPILQRNVERNISRVMQKNPDLFGSVKVSELQWGDRDHIRAVDPPFDYIIGTDVVYVEHLLEPLLQTVAALSGPRTTILLGYEIRSTIVHEQMLQMWKKTFDVKTVPKSKMDETFQHPSIQLFIMGSKPTAERIENAGLVSAEKADAVLETSGEDKISEENVAKEKGSDFAEEKDDTYSPNTKHSDWEARRYGSMAARMLRDVKIT
ncbi:uncharacterized protein LOC129312850 isoform X2 [Prosopis cineraria]|uniref:uncharacterized protein LOC129312850 isoform X2 n=1 Tax=Prosopis cineraria TaxID=364024 RepID=UPI002410B01D|nr:uncharacterized protein LOC129312850 isoform X2 [Prosopis cineraria]